MHNTYIHKFFSTSHVSFYGCIFMRIEILVSVPWGNDDKYAKVSSFISHGSCSLWQLQIIIYLVELVAYTSIHASPCRRNIPYLTKTLVLLCLSGAQRNSYMIVLPWIFLKSQSSFCGGRSYWKTGTRWKTTSVCWQQYPVPHPRKPKLGLQIPPILFPS